MYIHDSIAHMYTYDMVYSAFRRSILHLHRTHPGLCQGHVGAPCWPAPLATAGPITWQRWEVQLGRFEATVTNAITIWLFNIAMENPLSNGGFNGKIIYKWVIFHGHVK